MLLFIHKSFTREISCQNSMLLCCANSFEEGRAKLGIRITLKKKSPRTSLGRIMSRKRRYQDKPLLCIKQMEIMLRNIHNFKTYFFSEINFLSVYIILFWKCKNIIALGLWGKLGIWGGGSYRGGSSEKQLKASPMSNRANASWLQDRQGTGQDHQWQW